MSTLGESLQSLDEYDRIAGGRGNPGKGTGMDQIVDWLEKLGMPEYASALPKTGSVSQLSAI
jgi:hypothetical protein